MTKEKKETTKTIGEKVYEIQSKKNDEINAIDLQKEIHKGTFSDRSYEDQVQEAVKRGCKNFEEDFFVVVLFKKERLLQNVLRQYFFPRISCPTPQYDQVVYKYEKKKEKISFIWVIPDIQSCRHIPDFGPLLPEEQQQFVQFIRDFRWGRLDKLCAKLNGESYP